jgi:hypothetical protein
LHRRANKAQINLGLHSSLDESWGSGQSVIPKLFADFAAQGESEIWNIQISDQVTAPVIRQTIKRGHGNM